jgi:chemotaxis protein methyltransferase CheR
MAFTFFFRDQETLDLISEHVFSRFADRGILRIWDAGCATGEEPYSLAILFAERVSYWDMERLRIDATDIDESGLGQFGRIIAKGVYSRRDLDGIPQGYVERYFRPTTDGSRFELDSRLRSSVVFRRHDLLSLEPIGFDYDLIVCKNVLMHFSPEQQAKVLRMFYGCLKSDGFLAVDHAQKLPVSIPPAFEAASRYGQIFRRLEDLP